MFFKSKEFHISKSLSFESSNARKISLEGGGGGGNQDPGDPGVGKVRGGRIFFLQAGGGTDPGLHYVCFVFLLSVRISVVNFLINDPCPLILE